MWNQWTSALDNNWVVIWVAKDIYSVEMWMHIGLWDSAHRTMSPSSVFCKENELHCTAVGRVLSRLWALQPNSSIALIPRASWLQATSLKQMQVYEPCLREGSSNASMLKSERVVEIVLTLAVIQWSERTARVSTELEESVVCSAVRLTCWCSSVISVTPCYQVVWLLWKQFG